MKNRQLFSLIVATTLITPTVVAQDTDPVLIKVGDKSITKSAFEYTYNKNAEHQLESTTPQEYLDLFVNYQLKVLAAEEAGIDTTTQFAKELAGYRTQLAQPYLIDNLAKDLLLAEAYNRTKEEVEVSHILFGVKPTDSYLTKQRILIKAKEVREKLVAGENFERLAREFSTDPSVKANGGYLGYITSGLTVYPFETAAYNTPVGTISEPVATNYGYHLVKVSNRRPSKGQVRVAHIMVMMPQGISKKTAADKQQKIEEAYAKLQEGVAFEEVVKSYSEDTQSISKGGELRWFASGQMVKEFADVAFSLSQEGEVSQPIRSPYGWHIIKLLEKKGVATFEEKKPDLEKRIARDERANKGVAVFIESLKKKYNYELNVDLVQTLERVPRNTPERMTKFVDSLYTQITPLFTFDNQVHTLADLAAYTATMQDAPLNKTVKELTELYASQAIMAYEDSRLEEQYPDFKNLVQEYRDGMLLFEISNREVWEKSTTDTHGIEKFFKSKRRKYKWDEPRFKGYIVQCNSEETAQVVKESIATLAPDTLIQTLYATLNNDTLKQVKVVHGLYKKGDNAFVDHCVFATGELEPSEQLPIVFTEGDILKKYPTEYTDVKGVIISDYQKELEEKWLKKLRKSYRVEIDKDVLKTVNSR